MRLFSSRADGIAVIVARARGTIWKSRRWRKRSCKFCESIDELATRHAYIISSERREIDTSAAIAALDISD